MRLVTIAIWVFLAGGCTFITSKLLPPKCQESESRCDGSLLVLCEGGFLVETNCSPSICDPVALTCRSSLCGNEIIEAPEECDGFNIGAATCQTLGFAGGTLACASSCGFDTLGCIPIGCGDGTLDTASEQCDDANNNDDDGCSAACQIEFCGDGIVNFDTVLVALDQCDDGNNNNNDGCNATCRSELCGDDIIQSGLGEECDDGNLTSNDGCGPTCRREFCGDGVVNLDVPFNVIDQCDNGTNNSNSIPDSCRLNCTLPVCGDFVVDPSFNEQCEGADLAGQSCVGLGFDGGPLSCQASCSFNTSQCALCGNGVLDLVTGELCDNGGQNSDATPDACRTDCTTAHCGDGVDDSADGCDDGNLSNDDGCNSQCIVEFCGDGVKQSSEQCDNGGANSNTTPNACRSSCTFPVCGDFVVDPSFNEQCEGADLSGQSCVSLGFLAGSLSCLSSCGFNTAACVGPGCGNGILEASEQCEDGNTQNNDGCSSQCLIELCGDGIVNFDANLNRLDQCDDGNLNNNDGCNSFCGNEFCGDNIIQTGIGENCDDGNANNNDGCSSLCHVEFCSDGAVNNSGTEQCDDGNLNNNDGCNSFCGNEFCGDNIIQTGIGENCDDGNASNNDGCNFFCRVEFCGDGIRQSSEQCDNGGANSNTAPNACRLNCALPFCGDDVIDNGEACDDGAANANASNACRLNCALPVCRDGIVDPAFGEQCDDGNGINNDGCKNNCTL